MFESDNKGLYVEKYRPDTLEGYVGNENVVDNCKQWLEQGEIPNLLFYGTAGTGKCLGFTECIDIEIDLTDEEYALLAKYGM
jgi:replication-associated recombination protein RarA